MIEFVSEARKIQSELHSKPWIEQTNKTIFMELFGQFGEIWAVESYTVRFAIKGNFAKWVEQAPVK
jgi:hypothetical protein